MSTLESVPKALTSPGRRGVLLLPPLLAVMGMALALLAATMGQDARRARDTSKMYFNYYYWEAQRAKAAAGESIPETPEELQLGVEVSRRDMQTPPWEFGYAKFGRQFAAWDGYRYEEIVQKGYFYHQPGATAGEKAQSNENLGGEEPRAKNVVWYPLYPLLAAGLVKVLHIPAIHALTAVAWLSCLAGSVLFMVFARRHFVQLAARDSGAAQLDLENANPAAVQDSAALLAVMLLLFGPCSIFLYANFTESLFVLLMAAFLLCLQSRWWWRAALVAGLASACRSQGVLFGPILALTFLLRAQVQSPVQKLAKAAGLGIVSALGLAGYMLFLQERFHDPLAFMHAQVYWNVAMDASHALYALNPYHLVQALWHRATSGPMDWPRLWEILCLIWPPVVLVLGRKKLTFELMVLGWVMWALPFVSNSMAGNPPLTSQWMSMGRFMAVLLPAQLIVGEFLARRPRLAPFVLIPSAAIFALFAYQYGDGAWVG